MGHCIIKKIHIAHFRSIVNETINVSDFNIFVGMNDVGKSNVLKALDMFFNYTPEKYKFEDNFSLIYNQPRKKQKKLLLNSLWNSLIILLIRENLFGAEFGVQLDLQKISLIVHFYPIAKANSFSEILILNMFQL